MQPGLTKASRSSRQRKSLCSFQIEKSLNKTSILGLDEVGRGCIAGPVVAAGLIFPPEIWTSSGSEVSRIDDSKRIPESQREALVDWIMSHARLVKWSFVEAARVDELNILQASFEAFRQVCQSFELDGLQPDVVLVDGNQEVPGLKWSQRAVIGGDRISKTIAAASLVAKVLRDRWMREQAEVYPQYGFERHKGYGTAAHWEALKRHGPCPLHRRSFLRKYETRQKLGTESEAKACELYLSQGYQLRERNWRSPQGEIDFIVENQKSLRFVEVRARQDGELEQAFPEKKKRQFQKMVLEYLQRSRGPRKTVHLDLVFVGPQGVDCYRDFLSDA